MEFAAMLERWCRSRAAGVHVSMFIFCLLLLVASAPFASAQATSSDLEAIAGNTSLPGEFPASRGADTRVLVRLAAGVATPYRLSVAPDGACTANLAVVLTVNADGVAVVRGAALPAAAATASFGTRFQLCTAAGVFANAYIVVAAVPSVSFVAGTAPDAAASFALFSGRRWSLPLVGSSLTAVGGMTISAFAFKASNASVAADCAGAASVADSAAAVFTVTAVSASVASLGGTAPVATIASSATVLADGGVCFVATRGGFSFFFGSAPRWSFSTVPLEGFAPLRADGTAQSSVVGVRGFVSEIVLALGGLALPSTGPPFSLLAVPLAAGGCHATGAGSGTLLATQTSTTPTGSQVSVVVNGSSDGLAAGAYSVCLDLHGHTPTATPLAQSALLLQLAASGRRFTTGVALTVAELTLGGRPLAAPVPGTSANGTLVTLGAAIGDPLTLALRGPGVSALHAFVAVSDTVGAPCPRDATAYVGKTALGTSREWTAASSCAGATTVAIPAADVASSSLPSAPAMQLCFAFAPAADPVPASASLVPFRVGFGYAATQKAAGLVVVQDVSPRISSEGGFLTPQPVVALTGETAGSLLAAVPPGLTAKAELWIASPVLRRTNDTFTLVASAGTTWFDFADAPTPLRLSGGMHEYSYFFVVSIVDHPELGNATTRRFLRAACSVSEVAVPFTSRCDACPEQAFCDGTTSVRVKGSYWRPNEQSPHFYSCEPPFMSDTCAPNTTLGVCLPGHSGPRCSVCEPGYASLGDRCQTCGDRAASITAVVFSVLIIVVVFVILVWTTMECKKSDPFPTYVKILINHLTITSLTGDFIIQGAPETKELLSWSARAARPSPKFPAMTCATGATWHDMFISIHLFPIAIGLALASVIAASRAGRDTSARRKSSAKGKSEADAAAVAIEASNEAKDENEGEGGNGESKNTVAGGDAVAPDAPDENDLSVQSGVGVPVAGDADTLDRSRSGSSKRNQSDNAPEATEVQAFASSETSEPGVGEARRAPGTTPEKDDVATAATKTLPVPFTTTGASSASKESGSFVARDATVVEDIEANELERTGPRVQGKSDSFSSNPLAPPSSVSPPSATFVGIPEVGPAAAGNSGSSDVVRSPSRGGAEANATGAPTEEARRVQSRRGSINSQSGTTATAPVRRGSASSLTGTTSGATASAPRRGSTTGEPGATELDEDASSKRPLAVVPGSSDTALVSQEAASPVKKAWTADGTENSGFESDAEVAKPGAADASEAPFAPDPAAKGDQQTVADDLQFADDEDVVAKQRRIHVFVVTLVVVAFLAYPSVTQWCASAFLCDSIDYGTYNAQGVFVPRVIRWFDLDRSVECDGERHQRFMVAAAVLGILWGAGVPIGAVLLYRHYRKPRPIGMGLSSASRMFTFMVAGYEPRYWWWESTVMMRKLLIVIISQTMRQQRLQTILSAWVMMTNLVAQHAMQPYEQQLADHMEHISLTSIVVTLNLALLFEFVDPLSIFGVERFKFEGLRYVIFSIHLAVVLWMFIIIVVAGRHHFGRKIHDKRARISESLAAHPRLLAWVLSLAVPPKKAVVYDDLGHAVQVTELTEEEREVAGIVDEDESESDWDDLEEEEERKAASVAEATQRLNEGGERHFTRYDPRVLADTGLASKAVQMQSERVRELEAKLQELEMEKAAAVRRRSSVKEAAESSGPSASHLEVLDGYITDLQDRIEHMLAEMRRMGVLKQRVEVHRVAFADTRTRFQRALARQGKLEGSTANISTNGSSQQTSVRMPTGTVRGSVKFKAKVKGGK